MKLFRFGRRSMFKVVCVFCARLFFSIACLLLVTSCWPFLVLTFLSFYGCGPQLVCGSAPKPMCSKCLDGDREAKNNLNSANHYFAVDPGGPPAPVKLFHFGRRSMFKAVCGLCSRLLFLTACLSFVTSCWPFLVTTFSELLRLRSSGGARLRP